MDPSTQKQLGIEFVKELQVQAEKPLPEIGVYLKKITEVLKKFSSGSEFKVVLKEVGDLRDKVQGTRGNFLYGFFKSLLKLTKREKDAITYIRTLQVLFEKSQAFIVLMIFDEIDFFNVLLSDDAYNTKTFNTLYQQKKQFKFLNDHAIWIKIYNTIKFLKVLKDYNKDYYKELVEALKEIGTYTKGTTVKPPDMINNMPRIIQNYNAYKDEVSKTNNIGSILGAPVCDPYTLVLFSMMTDVATNNGWLSEFRGSKENSNGGTNLGDRVQSTMMVTLKNIAENPPSSGISFIPSLNLYGNLSGIHSSNFVPFVQTSAPSTADAS